MSDDRRIVTSPVRVAATVAEAAVKAAEGYASQALSEATLRAYRSDWAQFRDWCVATGLQPLPAEPSTVAGTPNFVVPKSPPGYPYKFAGELGTVPDDA